MAFLFKFSIILCTFLFYSASCVPVQNTADLRIPEPFSLLEFCSNNARYSHVKKLSCLFCNGFTLSCFIKSTTTTSTTSTTTTTPSTTTAQSTTASSSTTTSSTTTLSTTTPTIATTITTEG